MKYELVIQPTRGWLRIDWRSLAHYRELGAVQPLLTWEPAACPV